jgi:hypothetical protein
VKDELKHLITGFGEVTGGNLIQAARLYLRTSQNTGTNAEPSQLFDKKEEISFLLKFAKEQNILFSEIDQSRYIGEGTEQKVYLLEDTRFVIKLNDTIFYEFWEDYLISLLIHNYLFPITAYELIGFYFNEKTLYSVVKQPFIKSDALTDNNVVRFFLEKNGFIHKKNNDYENIELGIILEDLHEENVLTNNGVFFFIDTVFILCINA